jgi:hypothetical protein
MHRMQSSEEVVQMARKALQHLKIDESKTLTV